MPPSSRARTIRLLATILAALLVALGVAVALGSFGYNFFLSLGREPLVVETRPAATLTVRQPTPPARLQAPGARRSTVSAVAHGQRGGPVTCTVIVPSPGLELLGGTAGLSSFSSATGGSFRWAPLAGGAPQQDGSIAVTILVPSDDAALTLAVAEPLARHGYLVRRSVTPADASGRPIRLEPVARPTIFQLQGGLTHAGPLQLERVGDNEWRPGAVAPAGLILTSNRVSMLLGPGEYELVDPVDTGVRQRFRVPATDAVTIEERLARPRGRLL